MNWPAIKAALWEMHTHLAVWYGYLVGASVALQESWSGFETYVPVKLRHWIIGAATVIVIANRMYQGAKKVGGE